MARASINCDVSVGATAQIATALMIDLGIVTAEDTSKIVDKSKIKRERDRVLKEFHTLGLSENETQLLTGIIFDGKKVQTKVLIENEEGEQVPRVVEIDHYPLVDAVDGSYLTHVEPKNGIGKGIAQIIYDWLVSVGQEGNVIVVGADSTSVNTGWRSGAIHSLEVLLKVRVIWDICQLHINELPLRHLIENLDGQTSSKNTFTGVIGKMICSDVQNLETNTQFKIISVENDMKTLPDEIVCDLTRSMVIHF